MSLYKKYNFDLSGFQCLFFVFFLIFGPKVSLVDLSVLIPVFLLILGLRSFSKFSKEIMLCAALLAFLLVYQAIVQLVNQVYEAEPLLRLLRALLVCLVCSTVVGGRLYSTNSLVRALFYSLLIHALIIDVAAVVDPLNELLSLISGNDRIKPLRASGFLAGFDIAGLLCIFGTLMLALKVVNFKNSSFVFFAYLIFALACFFTSRVSMALYAIIFVPTLFLAILKSKLAIYWKYMVVVVSGYALLYVVYNYLLPIVDVTFSLGWLTIDDELFFQIISRHAVQSEDQFLWADMFFLPGTLAETFFGTGQDALESDVGYIKDIFRYGVFGSIVSFVLYYLMFKFSRPTNPAVGFGLKFIVIIYLLNFVLSFKNGYIFTRGLFPVFVLVVCVALMKNSENMLKSKEVA